MLTNAIICPMGHAGAGRVAVKKCGHVHRLHSPVHLPAAGNGLLAMAATGIYGVIYIIIASHMKATHTTSAPTARMHQALAAAGIVIAIMCALVLMKDAKTAGASSALPQLHVPQITVAAPLASVKPLPNFIALVVRLF